MSLSTGRDVVVLEGGLGNQLFQFAYALGRTGAPAVLDNRRRFQWGEPLRRVLRDGAWRPVSQRELVRMGQCPRLPRGQRTAARIWGARFGRRAHARHRVAPDAVSGIADATGGCLLEGYFQNEAFVDPVRGALLESFRPELLARHEALPASSLDVAISLRLAADYQRFNVVLPDSYYSSALQALTRDGDWTLHVCSDDGAAAADLFARIGYEGRIVDHSDTGAIQQLRVLASARRVAISNSTFAWWGAWLGDAVHHTRREVYAPGSWLAAPDSVAHSTWRRLPITGSA